MNSGHTAIDQKISRFEDFADWCAWLIVVGLVLEVALAAGISDCASINKWGVVGSDALVALGVAGEILFSRKARSLAEKLQRDSQEKIAEANERASLADQKAADAQLELARLRVPRYIRPEQVMQIAEAVRHFAGTPYDFTINSTDPGNTTVVWGLKGALGLANWTPLDWPGLDVSVMNMDGQVIGVGVSVLNIMLGVLPSAPQSTRDAAVALEKAVAACGIVIGSTEYGGMPYALAPKETVHIMIGRKT